VTALGFFKKIFSRSPVKIAALVVFIILAGALEGVSFTLFIPLISMITSSAQALAGAAEVPFLNRIFIELGLAKSLPLLLAVIVLIAGEKNIFLYLQKMAAAKISVDFEVDLKKSISRSVLASDWRFYLDQKAGTLMNAMTTAANKAAMAFQMESQLAAEILNVTLYCAVGLVISWQAFLISMAAGLVYVYFSKSFIRISRSIGVEGVDVDSLSQSAALEDFTGIKFIKGNALEEERKKNLFPLIDKYGKIAMRREKYAAILETLPEFFMAVIMCCIFYFSHAYFRVPGENLLVLLVVLYRFNRRMMTVQTLRQRLIHYLPAYELCDGIISEAGRLKERTGSKKFTALRDGIRFDDVAFSYTGHPVLESVSFEIKKNGFVAFLGKSGSGKTTILDLLMDLLKAKKGSVTLDGRPIGEYDIFSFRSRIGYVPQEPFLVNGTIAENIKLGNGDLSREKISAAARSAHADEFIDTLPQRYDTVVGDRGIKLSGGQRQRVALARALARGPELLILDEATSALDNRSESMIQKAINELKGKVTMVVVAHRISSVQKADMIYMVDAGRIVASGTIEELRERSRTFKELYMVE